MARENFSIHPRNWGTRRDKVNTRKSKNKDLIKAKLVRMEKHLEAHPADGATRNHMAKKAALL